MITFICWERKSDKQELCEAADEIGRLRNTLHKALAATDFDWAKQLIRQALNQPEKRL